MNSLNNELLDEHNIYLISFALILMLTSIILVIKNSSYKNEKIYSDKEKDKFRLLLKYATDGVHILDFKGNLMDCSESFHKSLGYEYKDLINTNILNWDFNLKKEHVELYCEDVLDEEKTYKTKFKRKDGSLFDVEVIAKSILINNITYIYASSRDISQRMKLKKEIQYERDLLNDLFNNIEAVVAMIKPDGTMSRVNAYTEKITGYTSKEISSRPYFWFDKFLPTDIRPDIQKIVNCIEADENIYSKNENEWIVKNGERRLFEWSNKIIYENDKPEYLLTVGIDITDRKKLEKELIELNNGLENRITEATKKLNNSLDIIEQNIISSKTDLEGNIIEVS